MCLFINLNQKAVLFVLDLMFQVYKHILFIELKLTTFIFIKAFVVRIWYIFVFCPFVCICPNVFCFILDIRKFV